ncbi:hypothetical protein ACLMAL_16470 [Nocardia sp. CWNU-33]|uniref:hypothetical protein n=1 Tax=Nocardia sp. CWNU-33 TaxID=3392117 RepID=UPI00398EE43C
MGTTSGGRTALHPPADPSIPSSHPQFGSDRSILNRSEAGLISTTTAPSVQLYFDHKGYDFAGDLLDQYLANHGADYEYIIRSVNVAQIVKTQAIKSAAESQLNWIKGEARRNGDRGGAVQEITAPWEPVSVTDDSDVTLALGTFSVAVGSDTTVQKSDDKLKADIRYRIYVYDLYDFDKTVDWWSSDPELAVKKGLNHDMRQLEEAGWARSFKARGNTESLGDYTWSGDL